MRTALLNLPWNENGRLGVRAGSRWPFTSNPGQDGQIHYIPFPFFLAYAASLLKKKYKEVKLIDAIASGVDGHEFIKNVRQYNPELIVIETSTPSFGNDIRIIKNIREQLSDSKIALCGPHASVFPRQILEENKFIDYIFFGEYEYTVSDLVGCLDNAESLENILGLVYRSETGIKTNPPRPTIDNLDDLPWPERGDVPIYRYNDGFAGLPQPNVQMWASRGCSFQCTFCLWPQVIYGEHKYRKRDPVDVVDEMEWLINQFGFKAIYFDDDVFNMDKKQVLGICNEINRRRNNIPWAAMARADLMDYEILESMRTAGAYAIKYGIESASQEILNSCKKNMDLEKAKEAIRITKKLGIKVHLTFCSGLPGETERSVAETNKFIKDVSPDSLQFSFAVPFPGTSYFNYARDKGWPLSDAWSDYDGNYKSIIKTEYSNGSDLKNQDTVDS